MGTANPFDLEQAIATWRRFLASSKGLLPDDLDELETHLRDEYEACLATGLDPESAYRKAQQRVGDYDTIESAYQPLYWQKVYHERRLRDELTTRLSMLKNYLKIALRTLVREKGYAFINVFGLAVGMACCLLILLFIQKERTYDRFHDQSDQIYRLAYSAESGGTVTDWAYSGAQWGPALAEAFPEEVAAARLQGNLGDGTDLVRYNDNTFSERHIYFADPAVFDVFTLPLLHGDAATALDAPYTIVLSTTMAHKYFGGEDPVGKMLNIDGSDYRVTGVYEALPSNSHIRLDMLASFATLLQDQPDYNSLWLYTYLLLDESSSAESVQAKLPAFMGQHIAREGFLAGLQGLSLQPLTDLHLRSHRQGEPGPGGNPTTLSIFSVVAFLVLALACINFMNLSTARSTGRAREVGMRKTLGANRRQLILQFIGEAVLLCMLSVVLAVGMAWLCLPFFSTLAGTSLSLSVLSDPRIVGGLLAVTVLLGMVTGSYPAFVLSAFQPATVLKGQAGSSSQKARLRQVLVVGQFAVSIALLIGTGIVYQQLDFIRSKTLGFEQDQLLTIPLSGSAVADEATFEAFRSRLLQRPDVLGVTASSNRLGERIWIWNYRPEGWQDEEEYWTTPALLVDYDYIDTYGMEIVAGRNFSRDHGSDATDAILINESAARFLDWDAPVGKTMAVPANESPHNVTVVGVVKDFHFASLHQEVAPLIINLEEGFRRYLTVKISTDNVAESLAFLEDTWAAFEPERPPQFSFVDDQFAQLYAADQRLSRIIWACTGLALLVACLGLLGLISFTTEQRRKEIGVRKVLGASVPGIVMLLSKDFLKLIALAFMVAVPLTYFAAARWLDGFAYRTEVGVAVFLLAGALTLLIALATVSYHAVRAATANPVKALRYE